MVDSRKSKTGLARLLLTFVLILGGFFAHIALFNQSYAAVGETYTLLINENSIAGYGIYDTNDTNRTGVYPILMNLNNNRRRSENVLVYCIQHGVPTSNGTRGYTEKVWSSTTIKSLPNVQWILNNSYPNKTLSSLASDATTAGYPVSDLKPDQAVSATQAAIWHFTDGFNLDANQYRSVMVSTNTYVKKDGVVTYVMYQANDRNWYMLKNDGSKDRNTIDLYKKYTDHPAIPSNYKTLGSFSKLDETNDPYTKIYSNAVSRFNQFQDNLQNLYKYLVKNASYANTLEIEPQYISVTGPATTVTADKIGPFTVNNLTTVKGKINTADTRTVKLTSSDPNVVFKYADGTAVDLNAVIPNKPFYGSITSGPGSVTLKAEGATDVPIGRVFVAKGKQTLISGAPVLTNPAPAATANYTRPKNIDIPITKIWKNANGGIMAGPESGDDVTSITVDLIQQGSTSPLQSVTLTAPNWSGKFTNIPAYNSDGKPAVYTYSERNVPKGYVCDGVGLIDPNNLSKGLQVVNKKSYGTFDFVKTSSNNYPLPGATITITDSSNKIVIQGMTDSNGKLTKPTIGSENFNLNGQISLPNGTYTITESTAPLGYKIAPPITIIIEGGITKLNGAPSSQVIMKDTEEPTSLTITKNWTSPDGTNIINSIANQYKATFVLQQDLNKTGDWNIVYDSNNSPITGEIFGNGSYTFNNLARYNKNDTEIAYRALESAVNVPAGEGTFKEMTTPGSKNVTNQLQQENVEITVIKKWVQIDGSTPLENANEYTATFALYADGNPTGRTVTITGNNSDKFDLLPMYNDTTGKKIVYTVQETKVSGFTSSEPNVSTDGKTFTFTNKQDRNTEKITIVAQKQWALNDGTPIEDNKASNYSATFVLKANGDVVRSIEFKGNKIGQNKVNFGEYPKYDDNNVAIKYTVEEILNTAGFVSDTTLVEVPTNGLVTFVNKSTTKNLQGSIGTKVSLDGVANGNKKYDNNGRLTVIPQKATNITVTDTVSYKGLVPSEEYYLTATLNKIVDGKAIAIKTLENILQKANSAGEGTWTVNFENMTLEPDTTYVVFEKAISKNILVDTNRDGIKDEYQGGDNDLNKDGIPTLEHKNIDDFAQTIVVEPKFEGETPVGQLKTTVKVDDKVGSDTVEAKLIQKDAQTKTVTDTVYYTLVKGQEYTIAGTLQEIKLDENGQMEKDPLTGEVIKKQIATSDKNETVVGTGSQTQVDLTFTGVTLKPGYKYVVFETATATNPDKKIFDVDGDNSPETSLKDKALDVLKHDKVDDKAQTIVVEKPTPDTPGKGTFSFTKVDASTSEPVQGAIIEFYTDKDELIISGRTDNNGKIVPTTVTVGQDKVNEDGTFTLEAGSYYFLEKDAPSMYKINPDKHPFVIENGKVTKDELANVREDGYVKIVKIGSDTGNRISGAVFDVYAKDGKLNGERVVKAAVVPVDGLEIKLPIGSYRAVEIVAPAGYSLSAIASENEHSFDITTSEMLTPKELVVYNQKSDIPVTSSPMLYLTKVDSSNGRALEGAVLQIFRAGNSEPIITGTTDSNGRINKDTAEGSSRFDIQSDGRIALSLGDYEIVEKAAPNGYILATTSVHLSVTTANMLYEVSFENTPDGTTPPDNPPTPPVPETPPVVPNEPTPENPPSTPPSEPNRPPNTPPDIPTIPSEYVPSEKVPKNPPPVTVIEDEIPRSTPEKTDDLIIIPDDVPKGTPEDIPEIYDIPDDVPKGLPKTGTMDTTMLGLLLLACGVAFAKKKNNK